MAKIQPLLENIDKKYGANTQKANAEKQKLYKKQSVSTLASCLPMIVTMAIFIFMFSGLNNYATYNNVMNYNDLYTFHNSQYSEALELYLDILGTNNPKTFIYAKIGLTYLY